MSYSKLYDQVQSENPKISTHWLRDRVIDITEIISIKQQWTGIVDPNVVRGWYVEGPQGPPITLAEHEALIVLARDQDKLWRRMVYTKELMHAFDEPEEKTNSSEKFDKLADRLGDPTAEPNAVYKAEVKAVWRALAVLCPENYRQEQLGLLSNGQTSLDVVAARLKIPKQFVGELFRENFLEIVNKIN